MKINRRNNLKTRSIELFAAGWCNLNCSYCYIPKTEFLKTVHNDVIKHIKDGTYINDIKELFGPNELESISHWGTEPTLTVKLFKDFYKEIIDYYPDFKEIHLSSNFMTEPTNLITFINEVLPKEKALTISVQISLDGPPWITDANRIGGTTDRIIKNVKKVLESIDTIHKVKFNVKPTINVDQMAKLTNYDKLLEYYKFMDDTLTYWFQTKSSYVFQRQINPTLVVPWNYTQQDGKNFFEMYKNQLKIGREQTFQSITQPTNFYYDRLVNKVSYFREFFTKPHMFTCSAGDGQIGLGGHKSGIIQSCHRGFYLDYEDYENDGNDPETKEGNELGRSEILKSCATSDYENRKKLLRFLYVNRGFHDFKKHHVASLVSLIKELAKNGQVSNIYNDLKWCEFLAKFIVLGCCHLDNIMITSTFELQSPAYARLFGNGSFELMVRNYRKEVKEWNKLVKQDIY